MLGKLVAVWHGIVWYLREISGEARYDHYLELLLLTGRNSITTP